MTKAIQGPQLPGDVVGQADQRRRGDAPVGQDVREVEGPQSGRSLASARPRGPSWFTLGFRRDSRQSGWSPSRYIGRFRQKRDSPTPRRRKSCCAVSPAGEAHDGALKPAVRGNGRRSPRPCSPRCPRPSSDPPCRRGSPPWRCRNGAGARACGTARCRRSRRAGFACISLRRRARCEPMAKRCASSRSRWMK